MLDSQLMQCCSCCSPLSSSTLVGRCKRRQWLAFSTPQRSQVASGRPPSSLPFLSKGSFHPIPQFKHPSLCFSVLFLIYDICITLHYILDSQAPFFHPFPQVAGLLSDSISLCFFALLLCCFVGTKDLGTLPLSSIKWNIVTSSKSTGIVWDNPFFVLGLQQKTFMG